MRIALAVLTVATLTLSPRPIQAGGIAILGNGCAAPDPSVPASAGWAAPLATMFRDGVAVTNVTTSAETLAQFIASPRLQQVMSAKPRFIIAGFGQADAEAGTTTEAFATDLKRLAALAKDGGCALVFVTPPVLRSLDPTNGKPAPGVTAPADASAHAEAIAAVALETGSTLLDLRAAMANNYRETGDRSNWFIHPPLDVAKEPATNVRKHKEWRRPTPRHPSTFSESGAGTLAHWLVVMLRRSTSPLREHLVAEDGPPSADYKLVWQDEFDGAEIDPKSWACRHPGPRKDGINDPECLRLDGQGNLVIDIKQVGEKFHAGMISTADRKQWKHGYFECRTTMARQPGYWNAFWLMADTVGRASKDPGRADLTREDGTEIDIVEYLQTQGDVVHMNLHWNGYGELHKSSPGDAFIPGLREQEYHVFGTEWTSDGYRFYVDGREVWASTDAPSDVPEHIILSVEIGKWAGDIRAAKLPETVKVDWVRVWQKPAK